MQPIFELIQEIRIYVFMASYFYHSALRMREKFILAVPKNFLRIYIGKSLQVVLHNNFLVFTFIYYLLYTPSPLSQYRNLCTANLLFASNLRVFLQFSRNMSAWRKDRCSILPETVIHA